LTILKLMEEFPYLTKYPESKLKVETYLFWNSHVPSVKLSLYALSPSTLIRKEL